MPLLQWHIKSHHQGAAGPVRVRRGEPPARLAARRRSERVKDIHNYIVKGVLWQAFTAEQPVVLLIDEIDKADIEFPNDLLREIDRMEFYVYETRELVKAKHRPLVFITSNNEKELPDAFLRRCFFHYIKFPDADTMKQIVDVHFPNLKKELLAAALKTFYDVRNLPGPEEEAVAPRELLDWLKLLVAEDIPLEALQSKDDKVAVPPLVGALLKNEQDVHAVREARVHAAPQPLIGDAMRSRSPVTLEPATASRLEPLGLRARDGLSAAAADGELWKLRVTSVPEPERDARLHRARAAGLRRRPHAAVRGARRATAARSIGSTRYHDIVPAVERLEIGYTWYAQEPAAQPRQHQLQAAAADARVRDARRAAGRLAHRQLQLRQPARDRAPRRAEGRRAAPPRAAPRRHRARHRDVQHDRRRMAGGEGRAAGATGAPAAPEPKAMERPCAPAAIAAARAASPHCRRDRVRPAAARARAARAVGRRGRARHAACAGRVRARERPHRPHRRSRRAPALRAALRARAGRRRDRRPARRSSTSSPRPATAAPGRARRSAASASASRCGRASTRPTSAAPTP